MRLLLVEDEERVVDFVLRGLPPSASQWMSLATAQPGLELAQGYGYDLVILDIRSCDND